MPFNSSALGASDCCGGGTCAAAAAWERPASAALASSSSTSWSVKPSMLPSERGLPPRRPLASPSSSCAGPRTVPSRPFLQQQAAQAASGPSGGRVHSMIAHRLYTVESEVMGTIMDRKPYAARDDMGTSPRTPSSVRR